jgi:thioredoxin reductase (NADPH)
VRLNTEVVSAHGTQALEAIQILNIATRETQRLASDGLFIFIGADDETDWLPADITLDQRGFILAGADVQAADAWLLERDPCLLETSVPGIFACGDVRAGPVKRVAAAVGEGSMAIAFVHQYLQAMRIAPAGAC